MTYAVLLFGGGFLAGTGWTLGEVLVRWVIFRTCRPKMVLG